MSPFVPVIIACFAGPVLQFVVGLGVRLARAGASSPGGPARLTDLICIGLGVAALVIVCTTGTPEVWEIAFLFSLLWPVTVRLTLRLANEGPRRA